jgi:CO/xanthine dehydrogenase Mo-binding subunit
LRSSHLRDPVGPQIHFASESFIDEVAHAVGADPIDFRLKYLKAPRDIAVVKAAAEKYGWTPRVGPRKDQTGDVVTGRGFSYAQRSGTIVGVIAEIEVNKKTGRIWAKKFVVAHDSGQIINPRGLRECIEGNVVQSISRALYEEVTFEPKNVTSVDWISYPIVEIDDMPASVEAVLIDRPDVAPSGAGEPSMRPVAAAIGNAIFDATGVRMRRIPFTPDRVKQALSSS